MPPCSSASQRPSRNACTTTGTRTASSAPDGSHNMSYIAEVSRQIAISVNRDRTDPLTGLEA
jgi:hypothetical protein